VLSFRWIRVSLMRSFIRIHWPRRRRLRRVRRPQQLCVRTPQIDEPRRITPYTESDKRFAGCIFEEKAWSLAARPPCFQPNAFVTTAIHKS